ncbi:MAG: hypothetical protein AW09_003844 [Candidatus Accumulibacter phosphatis]|jgi:hypothetical protein|uniref:Uncharacterized protein n=1 Tax=Candidatus Accumulibacter phosphatis TaxID=327160 RepID=A0A080M1I4_9PROT|nr:MAG: hypothetical protein AW09_003844 [Candidatus Accumulibacter phosphatis]
MTLRFGEVATHNHFVLDRGGYQPVLLQAKPGSQPLCGLLETASSVP